MADKEPRRRKKRKDASRRDDDHTEEPTPSSQKTETRDSDPEIDDSHSIPPSQPPSHIAKIVFFVLFSVLVIAVGSVFIALHGVDRGPADIFNHGDVSHEIPIENLFSHSEEIIETEVIDEDQQHLTEPVVDTPSDNNILDPHIINEGSLEDELADHDYKAQDVSEESFTSYTSDSSFEDSKTEPFIEDHLIEETAADSAFTETSDETSKVSLTWDVRDSDSQNEPTTVSSINDDESFLKTVIETASDESNSEFAEIFSESTSDDKVDETSFSESDDFEENVPHSINRLDQDILKEKLLEHYERSDITNELDYDMKEALDDIDDMLEKEYADDDVNEVEDEFDFWQF